MVAAHLASHDHPPSRKVLKWRCVERMYSCGNRYISSGEGYGRCHKGIRQCKCNGDTLAMSHDYVATMACWRLMAQRKESVYELSPSKFK